VTILDCRPPWRYAWVPVARLGFTRALRTERCPGPTATSHSICVTLSSDTQIHGYALAARDLTARHNNVGRTTQAALGTGDPGAVRPPIRAYDPASCSGLLAPTGPARATGRGRRGAKRGDAPPAGRRRPSCERHHPGGSAVSAGVWTGTNPSERGWSPPSDTNKRSIARPGDDDAPRVVSRQGHAGIGCARWRVPVQWLPLRPVTVRGRASLSSARSRPSTSTTGLRSSRQWPRRGDGGGWARDQ
jgi:hypothetical protein